MQLTYISDVRKSEIEISSLCPNLYLAKCNGVSDFHNVIVVRFEEQNKTKLIQDRDTDKYCIGIIITNEVTSGENVRILLILDRYFKFQ